VSQRRVIIICLLAALLAFAMAGGGCGKTEEKAEEPGEESVSMSTTPGPTPGREVGPDGQPVKELVDFPDGQDGADVEAVIRTDKGEIVLNFYPDVAPVTVASFIHLARSGFYNGLRFHRVEPGFVIQGGDPKSIDPNAPDVGTGGPGYNLPAEFNERPHNKGTLSMARSQDPNSGGSQFFICLEAQPSLDGQYTVFGETVSGMEVVGAITPGDVMNEVIIRPKGGS
jgi:peptidyl-prolyl cis-trans isomerase B (cyclophilin B)